MACSKSCFACSREFSSWTIFRNSKSSLSSRTISLRVTEAVLGRIAQSPVHPRTEEFGQILSRVREGLSFLFQTRHPATVFASSGTGAMEAALVNTFATGDEVLVVNGGKFGERWGKIAGR